MSTTFRDRLRNLWTPPWLRNGNAEKFLYAMGVQVDMLGEALVAGIKSRFPGLYSDESLPVIGRERRIARGPAETSATYAVRLRRWLDDHRLRGGPYAMLAQLYAYHAPNNFDVALVYRNGRRFLMDAAGAITTDVVAFHPDTYPLQWARWWLFMSVPSLALPLTSQEEASYKLVPRQWNAAHTQGTLMLLGSGAELWNYPLGHVWNESGTWNTSGDTATLTIK